MKRNLLFSILLFVINSVYSQQDEWHWDEKTKDIAYETPTAKITKKWYLYPKTSEYYNTMTFNSNGTYTSNGITINNETGYEVLVKSSIIGTWKRVNKLSLQLVVTDVRYTIDKKDLAKLPARRIDELTKGIDNGRAIMLKKWKGTVINYDILRIDDDHLILKGRDIEYWASESLIKKLEEEEAIEKAKEEAERQAKEAEEEEKLKNEVYEIVEEMPQFPGGMEALMKWFEKNLKYPTSARENGIQGRVYVQFIVDKDGSIVEPEVHRSVDPELDKEALRLVSTMPKWQPGKQRGKTVRVRYTCPITFRLNF